MLSLLSTLLNWLLGLIFPSRKDPSAVQLAASNATAQTELAQQENANVVDQKADADRIAGDAAVVRDLAAAHGQQPAVDAAANAAIAKQFPDAFRD